MSGYLRIVVFCAITTLCTQIPCFAVVLHPDNEPNPATWTGKPHNDVVGRWGSNASCVAVAPSYIITTRHQGGNETNSTVNIGGLAYTINTIFNHPSADLRLVKLNNADLTEYASINFDPNEVDQVAVLGGYGVSRGATQEIRYMGEDYPYGYLWLYPTSPTPANGILGWGTNKVVATSSTTAGYTSELIVSQFDEPNTIEYETTEYECTIGEHDSGGGWFVPDDPNGWKVIGLSRGVAMFNPRQSIFLNPNSFPIPTRIPVYPNPMSLDSIEFNHLDAVRISSCADWIIDTMYAYANELQNLSLQWLSTGCDETNNYCNNADTFRDGEVNIKDFAVLAEKWLGN